MDKLVETIVRGLVVNQEAVDVKLKEKENKTVVSISADPEDIGKIIGKKGKIVNAIRTITKAAAIKYNIKVIVEIR